MFETVKQYSKQNSMHRWIKARINAHIFGLQPHYGILKLVKKLDEGKSLPSDLKKWNKYIEEINQTMPTNRAETTFLIEAQKKYQRYLSVHSF